MGKFSHHILYLLLSSIFIWCVVVDVSSGNNQLPEILEAIPLKVDEIELKQKEMRDTTVLVQTLSRNGSGIIIGRFDTNTTGIFEYHVLTNAHITRSRFTEYFKGANSLTGKLEIEIVDTGCEIIVFDYPNEDRNYYRAKVVAEDIKYDFAILLFSSDRELVVAKIANDEMLKQVRVFDEIYAVGCPFGQVPSPTTGIVSRILTGDNGKKKWIVYINTAQIVPGSSGGGLFKNYYGHYYLIGMPFRLTVSGNGQIIPHLAHAISIETAQDFIEQNSVIHP